MTKRERNIKLYKKAVKHWVNIFAMKTFQFHVEEHNDPETLGSCHWYPMTGDGGGGERIFTITYEKNWIAKAEPDEIYSTAFHEVMEALLYKMHQFGNNRNLVIPEREVRGSVHDIIRTFENCVLPYLPKEK